MNVKKMSTNLSLCYSSAITKVRVLLQPGWQGKFKRLTVSHFIIMEVVILKQIYVS